MPHTDCPISSLEKLVSSFQEIYFVCLCEYSTNKTLKKTKLITLYSNNKEHFLSEFYYSSGCILLYFLVY